ncbi:bifunctional UDP-3-O-[3-hydroxymyristoyl] N-acetylglucosamine deacetylase/3-hydroxyacyl-ACP dehydratase [Pseudogemmatithrix spongiicola]|uniref:Multifunctional fusion protein n=1 Tax=Pseudogemmatithrix spongiicola TaxID=3062599 RepID=A0AA49JZN4_9BACT|nr:bifunctional UDP-3-O-[3-hydroxymyristoyl] N-acetylglucosamine deacetylase/3-hydroxyacyl-ACP dehydratase [Gemmatimonadaceae bacterium 'strain 138']WKW15052.1 bifunctional UDP-3-O-[3-hydroxymyristoyl] N-acetylglucosamine deacetylase/3-hydroxyacyl-ACP dehydratase [Gemmatimonadaceae bacterium 'strain 318']
MSRRTIARDVTVQGIGLHLGRVCTLRFLPAASGAGIRFRRTDLAGHPETPAHHRVAVAAERRTQLGEGDAALHTVEHVLAAVAGLCIDDLLIEMDSAEPPIMDGSAEPFRLALVEAGLREQEGSPDVLRLREAVRIVDGESVYVAHPAETLELEVKIDFPHPLIGAQDGRWTVTEETFARELAPARTFGMLSWVEGLRAKGLIQGASTENTIVLDETGVVDTTLRWTDEFVRHKAMDVVGDLALAGQRVRAKITATKPSHRGTVTLLREMLAHAVPAGPAAAANPEETRVLDIEDLMKILPHRYPFLLVDRVIELEPQKRVVAIKNVTINEPFFQGHFPGHPIMPGVLIVEAMAQAGGVLLMGAVEDPESKVVYFMSIDNIKFRKPVKPGDQLRFEVELVQLRGKVARIAGVAKVDGAVVCEAEMAAMVRDR